MDRAFKARLEARFGDRPDRTRPPAPRRDRDPDRRRATSCRSSPRSTTSPTSTSSSWATSPASTRARSCRSSTTSGATTTPDWLRVTADGLSRDDPRVPSVTFLWKGAEWMEREAYDMFGITFEGNRDLRRIYMPPDYQSFPLRKDFFLPDDAARSPGGGVRPMERTPHPDQRPVDRARPPDGRLTEPDRCLSAPPTPSADDPAGHARPRARRLRARPAVPAADRARGRVLHARRRRDVHQHGAAAPLDPRRAAGRAQARRREGRRPRPGPRLPPSRRREAVRERRLPPGDLLHGPARVRQLAVQRVGAGPRLREAAGRRGPAPRRVHPGPLVGAEPDRQPRPVPRLDGARPRRPDADPVVVHRARRDRRHARVADRPADALQLLPDRRRQRRPQPRVHEPPRRLDVARRPSRSRPATPCSTRTRSSSAGCAASARSTPRPRCGWS